MIKALNAKLVIETKKCNKIKKNEKNAQYNKKTSILLFRFLKSKKNNPAIIKGRRYAPKLFSKVLLYKIPLPVAICPSVCSL
jgi:RNase P/RNase MRP subunit p29